MKIFLDEDVPERLRDYLAGHSVQSVGGLGLKGTKNGKLLSLIEKTMADVFITADKLLVEQQALAIRPFATILLSTNSWPLIRTKLQSSLKRSRL